MARLSGRNVLRLARHPVSGELLWPMAKARGISEALFRWRLKRCPDVDCVLASVQSVRQRTAGVRAVYRLIASGESPPPLPPEFRVYSVVIRPNPQKRGVFVGRVSARSADHARELAVCYPAVAEAEPVTVEVVRNASEATFPIRNRLFLEDGRAVADVGRDLGLPAAVIERRWRLGFRSPAELLAPLHALHLSKATGRSKRNG